MSHARFFLSLNRWFPHLFTSIAAAFCLIAIVGGLLFAASLHQFSFPPNRHSLSPFFCEPTTYRGVAGASPGQAGLYATAIDGVYRYAAQSGHLSLIWQYWLRPPPDRIVTPVAVSEGVAYVGESDGTSYAVLALATFDGSVRWQQPVGGFLLSGPVVAGGLVFVVVSLSGGQQDVIVALDARDGSARWSYQFVPGETLAYIGGVGADPTGSAVFVSSGNLLFALNVASGDKLWSAQIESGAALLAPQWGDGILYLASSMTCPNCEVEQHSSAVYAYNPKSGALLWKTPPFAGFPSPPTEAGGVVYYGSQAGFVAALRASDGASLWQVDVGGEVTSAPQVVNGVVYVGAARFLDAQTNPNEDHGRVLALSATDGHQKWSYRLPSADYDGAAPLVGRDGALYVATSLAYIDTLWAATGYPIEQDQVRKYVCISRVPSLTLIP
ncbi:MAG TPA: PQQ-binding-like beta-propeller repeat protein [Ktedonobacterales bacterium]|jgi:outer membrane protein assembly factor BamB